MGKQQIRYWLAAVIIGLLAACGGGGGGDRAAGVEPGPASPNEPVDPPDPVIPGPVGYEDAREVFAFINSASFSGGNAVVDFQVTDESNTAITDLEVGNTRFVLAKLQASDLGGATGNWQSYVNRIEAAGSVGPGTEDKLQATYERDGTFENFGDGTYRYTFATDVNNLPADILAQAKEEELNLDYEPAQTHRVSIQFDGGPNAVNPFYDWIPETGEVSGIFNYQVALTDNCNRCHNPLAIHGGNRIEIEYCVTCHNPGTTDANSGNTVDMKVMIHKIHMGEDLPSVQDGEPYIIWGFRDRPHDYSHVVYPQAINNCQNCHVGSSTTNDFYPDVQLSNQGDNWNIYASRATCGSCHDRFDFSTHAGGQEDDSRCADCHSEGQVAGSIAESHALLVRDESQNYLPEILSVTNTGPGEFPSVDFRITNPTDGSNWDILNDDPWTQGGGDSRLAVTIGWDTGEYNNIGNEGNNASTVSIDALATATPNGDGSFNVVSGVAIPDGSLAPGVAASGSGAATIEGHPGVDVDPDEDNGVESVWMQNVIANFSIDEADGTASPRRNIVDLDNCNSCHQDLVIHGNNRFGNIEVCATCHNPLNTDRRVRETAFNPPTDGKDEESIHFTTMIHAIHAPSIRENPLQVVGFRGFTTYVYDEEHVQYPGNLADCTSCHGNNGYQLPLASSALGNVIDTGDDVLDPADDVVISPESAACYSCHENDTARAHMEQNGGNFATTQAALDAGEVTETCEVCHGSGRSADVDLVHGLLD